MKRILIFLSALALLLSCGGSGGFTKEEKELILSQGDIMRVLTVSDTADSLVLRGMSRNIPVEEIGGSVYEALASRMLATVQAPEQNGVGIAAPQVGISRRIIAVCRMDKEGEPFEIYPNIEITAFSDSLSQGLEGCLSILGKRGLVSRSKEITIRYTDPATLKSVTEDVKGFTAVIFQHECDHLDGVLYTDKADSLWRSAK